MRAVVAVVAVGLAACGGATAPAPGAAAPAPEEPAAAPEATSESVHAAGTGAAPVPVAPVVAPPPPPAPGVAAARGDLDRAERQLAASRSDCATACRALSSMERAAEHLCELDAGRECARARSRVEAARARVRASCGGCGS